MLWKIQRVQFQKNYETARDKEVALGAKHYTAKDCIEGNKGASNIYQITDEISLEILNQKYYYEKPLMRMIIQFV